MADAIVRLKLESQEYDAKLKRGIAQMGEMEKQVRRTGASFAYADKEELEFIKSLGEMNTQAQSAKQKLREYNDAITSLTATYRGLTEEERKSQFGKEMAASIDNLKVKAAQLQDIMSDTQREIQNLASDTNFTEGISLMTRTIGSCAAAVTAWSGSGKEMDAVIKDLAKIGTTVAAVEALTKAFQKQNLVLMKNPYVAAAAAAAALAVAIGTLIKRSQELSSVEKTLQDVQKKGREDAAKEITRIQSLNSIIHDNTRSLDERKAALAEIQALVPDYHGALTTEGNLINDNTDAMTAYVDELQRAATAQAAFDKMVELQKKKLQQELDLQEKQRNLATAQSRNQSAQGQVVYAGTEMTQVYTQQGVSQAESAVRKAEADIQATKVEIEALQNLINVSTLSTSNGKTVKTPVSGGGGGGDDLTPLQEAQKKIAELSNEALTADDERLEAIRQEIAGLQEQVSIYKKIQDYVQGINQSSEPQELNPSMPGRDMTDFEKLQQSLSVKLADSIQAVDMNSLSGLMTVAIQHGIDSLNPNFETLMQKMRAGLDIKDEDWKALEEEINAKLAEMNIAPITIDVKTGNVTSTVETATKDANSMRNAFTAAASAVSTVGSALQQIEDPAAKIAGIIAQAIAQVALTFAMSLKGTVTPWDWIAAAIAGTATMISTITAIKAVTSNTKGNYASGGIIPGNSFSGDNQRGILPDGSTIGVNAGELILSRSQQSNIASQLQGAGQQGGSASTPYVSGENIVLGVNNYFGRSGQGEIVTTSMLRRAGINI